MQKIRVLVVDDAVVVRRLVADMVASDPQLEVAGTAANGHIALTKLPHLKPDLVVLDVEMPEMDGLETLKAIRKTHPRLPVIMFSTLTERGATATLEALTNGANDYVTKPANVGSVTVAMQRLREELLPKIKGLCSPVVPPRSPSPVRMPNNGVTEVPPPKATYPVLPKGPLQSVEILAVGVSTGGPNALAELLSALPTDFPVPVVIVQHMPALFTKLLAERLQTKSPLKIREGIAGEVLRSGQVWIAPGGYHMVVERNHEQRGQVRLATNQEPPENSCRPAVDVLFRSVVKAYGAGTLALILTGMGRDGLRGCELIHHANGQILAQDEASSVVWGMPGVVSQAGLADKVLPLNQLAPEIMRRVQREAARSSFLKEANCAVQAIPAKDRIQ
jgi:two-component system, chemotaxis family, protein-glutamate methylesterase/glutaminase